LIPRVKTSSIAIVASRHLYDMATIDVKIENLEKLRSAVRNYPSVANPILARAINASLAHIHQVTGDDTIFQFKANRSKRTGYLQLSFGLGILKATPERLIGSIKPTAHYAPYVYFGTRRGIKPNPYIDRIALAATQKVNEFLQQAGDKIVQTLAKRINPI